eukprot:4642950-Prymnesium_polylepis.2
MRCVLWDRPSRWNVDARRRDARATTLVARWHGPWRDGRRTSRLRHATGRGQRRVTMTKAV